MTRMVVNVAEVVTSTEGAIDDTADVVATEVPIGNIGADEVSQQAPVKPATNRKEVVMSLRDVKVRAISIPRLNIRTGELLALLGSSGVGKTSLLEILAARRKATYSGRVRLHGSFTSRNLGGWIAFVPQYPKETLLDGLTVRQTLESNAFIGPAAIVEMLSALGLETAADTQIRFLSGGQVKRVAIALGFVCGARLVILDEPLSGLADGDALMAMESLGAFARRFRCGVLFSLHQPSPAILNLVDRAAIVSAAMPVQIFDMAKPANQQVFREYARTLEDLARRAKQSSDNLEMEAEVETEEETEAQPGVSATGGSFPNRYALSGRPHFESSFGAEDRRRMDITTVGALVRLAQSAVSSVAARASAASPRRRTVSRNRWTLRRSSTTGVNPKRNSAGATPGRETCEETCTEASVWAAPPRADGAASYIDLDDVAFVGDMFRAGILEEIRVLLWAFVRNDLRASVALGTASKLLNALIVGLLVSKASWHTEFQLALSGILVTTVFSFATDAPDCFAYWYTLQPYMANSVQNGLTSWAAMAFTTIAYDLLVCRCSVALLKVSIVWGLLEPATQSHVPIGLLYGLCVLCTCFSTGLAFAMAAAYYNPREASGMSSGVGLLGTAFGVLLVMSGTFLPVGVLPVYFRWIYCFSIFSHAFALLLHGTFSDAQLPCKPQDDPALLSLQAAKKPTEH